MPWRHGKGDSIGAFIFELFCGRAKLHRKGVGFPRRSDCCERPVRPVNVRIEAAPSLGVETSASYDNAGSVRW